MLTHLKHIFTFIFLCCFFIFSSEAQNQKFTVVIDPGHGGKDPGAVGSSSKEKDITLSVAIKLGELIESNHKDVKVQYTRQSDKFVALDQRAVIANNYKADLFISIHCNALPRKQKSPQGVETFILGLHRSKDNLDVAKKENSVILLEDDHNTKYEGFDPSAPESYIIFEYMSNQFMKQSLDLASLIQNNLVRNSKRVNRNVRQAGFLVLREVGMPSVLVELGYISNNEEEKYLKSKSGQTSLANSIFKAFNEYKKEHDKKSSIFSSASNSSSNSASISSSNSAIPEASNGEKEYRIQFLISTKLHEGKASIFKGLYPVEHYKDGASYKYTYGSTSNEREIEKTLKDVKSKFKDAFIVEFQNGVRIK